MICTTYMAVFLISVPRVEITRLITGYAVVADVDCKYPPVLVYGHRDFSTTFNISTFLLDWRW
jgi:hypothetical protein